MENLENWPEVLSDQTAEKTVRELKMVNDCAERAIAPASTFNSATTKHDERK